MPGVYRSLQIDSFEPDKYAELLSDANFEQRLLRGGRFQASLERLTLPNCRMDRGAFSLPCFAQGVAPEGWVSVGITFCVGEPAWFNGISLHADEIQLHAERAPIDYRTTPFTSWHVIQFRREFIQQGARRIVGIELPFPNEGFSNRQMPAERAAHVRAEWQACLRMAHELASSDDQLGWTWLEERLVKSVVQSVDWTMPEKDRSKSTVVHRNRRVLALFESHLAERLTEPFAIRDLVQSTGLSERSLEVIVGEAYGVSPRRLFMLARLHRLRRELLARDPKTTSIRSAMRSCGLMHAGRSAAMYHDLFGELPNATLNRGR